MGRLQKVRKRPIEVWAEQVEERREIHTREGTVVAEPGDYVIYGVEGEPYPVSEEIFEKTYDPVDTWRKLLWKYSGRVLFLVSVAVIGVDLFVQSVPPVLFTAFVLVFTLWNVARPEDPWKQVDDEPENRINVEAEGEVRVENEEDA